MTGESAIEALERVRRGGTVTGSDFREFDDEFDDDCGTAGGNINECLKKSSKLIRSLALRFNSRINKSLSAWDVPDGIFGAKLALRS